MTLLDSFDDYILNEKMSDELVKSSEEKRRKRAERIQVNYKGMGHRMDGKRIKTLKFYAFDPESKSQRTRNVSIQIPDYRVISKLKSLSTISKIEYAIMAGDIKVYCDCPDFRYVYSFLADFEDYGIKPETREPNITNPNLNGSVCKHIIAVFNQMDKFYTEIAQNIDEYSKKERKI